MHQLKLLNDPEIIFHNPPKPIYISGGDSGIITIEDYSYGTKYLDGGETEQRLNEKQNLPNNKNHDEISRYSVALERSQWTREWERCIFVDQFEIVSEKCHTKFFAWIGRHGVSPLINSEFGSAAFARYLNRILYSAKKLVPDPIIVHDQHPCLEFVNPNPVMKKLMKHIKLNPKASQDMNPVECLIKKLRSRLSFFVLGEDTFGIASRLWSNIATPAEVRRLIMRQTSLMRSISEDPDSAIAKSYQKGLKGAAHLQSTICWFCDFVHPDIVFLHRHTRMEHHVEYRYWCEECEIGIGTGYSLEAHCKSDHLKFTCQYKGCKSVYKKSQELMEHKRTHAADGVFFVCPREGCFAGYFSKGAITNHERTHFRPQFWCELCDYMSPIQGQVNSHMRQVHKL